MYYSPRFVIVFYLEKALIVFYQEKAFHLDITSEKTADISNIENNSQIQVLRFMSTIKVTENL